MSKLSQARYPSTKTIMDKLGLYEAKANQLRNFLTGRFTCDAIEEADHDHIHYSFLVNEVLKVCSGILESCGVEYLPHKKDTFSDSYGISFVNSGDMYTNTVIYDHNSMSFKIACTGDIIEKNNCYL